MARGRLRKIYFSFEYDAGCHLPRFILKVQQPKGECNIRFEQQQNPGLDAEDARRAMRAWYPTLKRWKQAQG